METNVAGRLLRGRRRLLVVGRCVEVEKPRALRELLDREGGYAVLSVCPEETHVNMIGFKLLGILARLPVEEVAVLTTDGSMHCIQLHYAVEELEKAMPGRFRRRHFIATRDGVVEIPPEAVKTSRFLVKVSRLLEKCGSRG